MNAEINLKVLQNGGHLLKGSNTLFLGRTVTVPCALKGMFKIRKGWY